MVKIIIVDDELNAQEVLAGLIKMSFGSRVSIVGAAQTVAEGIELIQRHQPDLVFLDIELTHATGFDLLEQLDEWDFQLIFCTAYDQYAIKAFKFSAVDYLLKPIDPDELEDAVERALSRQGKGQQGDNLKSLMQNRDQQNPGKKWLPIHSRTEVTLIQLEEIIRIQSEGAYSDIFLLENEGRPLTKLTSSKKIGVYEEILTDNGFFRSHNSHIINLNFLRRYNKSESVILLRNGEEVPLARSRKKTFEDYLSSL